MIAHIFLAGASAVKMKTSKMCLGHIMCQLFLFVFIDFAFVVAIDLAR